MKCLKCGAEFEGNFCSNCGAKVEPSDEQNGDAVKNETNSCSETDEEQKKPNKEEKSNNNSVTEKIKSFGIRVYPALRYIPAAMVALFTLLLFAFFAAPVAVMPGGDLMGEKIPSESYGNVYSMIEDLPSLKGSLIALIVFAAVAFIFSAFFLISLFAPVLKDKALKIAGKEIPVKLICTYASFAIYLIFFITGCVICGQIAKEDGGMGLVAAGAGPILLIVFSLLFLLVAAGSYVSEILLRKEPDVAEKLRAAEQAKQDKIAAYRSAYAMPVAPAKVEKPRFPAEVRRVNKFSLYKKLVTEIFFWAPVVYGLSLLALALLSIAIPALGSYMSNLSAEFFTPLIFVAIFLLICLPLSLRSKKIVAKKLRRKFLLVVVSILFLIAGIILLIVAALNIGYYLNDDGGRKAKLMSFVILCGICALACLIVGLVTAVCTAILRGKAMLVLYGTKKPAKKDVPLLDGEQLKQIFAEYKQNTAAYAQYKKSYSLYKKQLRAYNSCKPF